MKFSSFIFFIILITLNSCNDIKSPTETKSYKISGLKSNFSLPERFENISGRELAMKMEEIIASMDSLTKENVIKKQTHFIDYNNDDIIKIMPLPERIPLEKLFLNYFTEEIESEVMKRTSFKYELIEEKFITSKKYNSALKAKFKYKTKFGDKYFTSYLLTNKNESISLMYYSIEVYDLQDMVLRYLNKN